MDKEFIPYEQALALKELGFDEPCVYYVDKDNNSYIYNFQTHSDEFIEGCGVNVIPTPTFSQAFRWFREKHNIDGFVQIEPLNKKYGYVTYDRKKGNYTESERKYTFEDAELACLIKLIEIVKENKQ